MTKFLSEACALAILGPSTALAWSGEVPEIESLPLWLLGLFVTLMLFRVRAIAGRKGQQPGSGLRLRK
jgi:hypothetical protein